MVSLNTRFYLERILVIRYQYVNKESQDFRYYWNRIFPADILSECLKNMTKIVPWRFKESFGRFNILTVHKCSDTEFFRHLSNSCFWNLKFMKQITSETHLFFSKYSKSYVDLGNAEKISIFFFWFWDNCIWIGCVRHSLLLRQNTCHRVSVC